MRILIITTYYPPDTAIAAVRPYMLAKHLSSFGHKVTVIRSGMINKVIDSYYPPLADVEVISYLGQESDAEKYERGEIDKNSIKISSESRIAFLPGPVREVVSKAYHRIKRPIKYFDTKAASNNRLVLLKETINKLKEKGYAYDIVFSTYGELENAYAGEYAALAFNSKWIMDFRDPIALKSEQSLWQYALCKREQDRLIQKADCCTAISDDLFRTKGERNKKIKTLYNGYEDNTDIHTGKPYKSNLDPDDRDRVLSICYTGQLYGKRFDAAKVFIEAISILIKKNTICRNNVRLYYAGADSAGLLEIMKNYKVEDLLIDYGYLKKEEVFELQNKADVFLLFSWNTKYEKGVLTGKFYEGLRAAKPILTIISGNVPNSELYRLNERYKYGYCCESVKENAIDNLCDYIESIYLEKMNNGEVKNTTNKEMYSLFNYKNIAERFERIAKEMLH